MRLHSSSVSAPPRTIQKRNRPSAIPAMARVTGSGDVSVASKKNNAMMTTQTPKSQTSARANQPARRPAGAGAISIWLAPPSGMSW